MPVLLLVLVLVYSIQVQVQVNTELTREWILNVLIDGGQTNPSTEDLRGSEGLPVLRVLRVLRVLVHGPLVRVSACQKEQFFPWREKRVGYKNQNSKR